MICLDDVRDAVLNGRDAHGWSAVLSMIANELSKDADDNQAAGQVAAANVLDRASNHCRTAIAVIRG